MSNMVVNTNVLALNSHRAMKNIGSMQSKSSGRLSSGMRINSAADDAAGLAISEKMRAQIRGLDMASKNAQDATSLIQTAEGGMQEVDNMLQRIRELVVQVSNDTNENNKLGSGDRQKIQDEIGQLTEEIDSMGDRVEFNKKKLLDGTYADPTEMLASASTKYANAAADLEVATIKMRNAQTAQVNANKDYDKINKIVATFEQGLAKRQSQLDAALESMKEFASGIDVITNSAGVALSSFNAQALEGALKGFTRELAAMDPSKWTETTIRELANKYFAQGIGSEASKAGYAVATGTTSGAATSSRIETNTLELNNTNGVSISLMLVGSRTSTTGATKGQVVSTGSFDVAGIKWDGSSSLNSLIGKAYTAWQELQYWDSDGSKAVNDIYKVAGASTSTAEAAFKSGTISDIPTSKSQYSSAANQISDNINFKSSADMYKAQANISGTKVKADTEYSNWDREVNTLKSMLDTYRVQIKSANNLMADLNGKSAGLYFQVGSNANQHLRTSIGSVKSDILGIGNGEGKTKINVLEDTGADITSSLNVLDEALSYVTTQRSKLGAAQNRLEYTVKSLDISSENLSAAESRIRDADMAKEMMNVTKSNVLQQAAVSMLSQANQAPQTVLQLLR